MDIFLSYARNDKARVAPLVTAIEAHGWSVWWDADIATGEEFDDVIAAQLNASHVVVVAWTPVSVASRWVRSEARIGAERGVLVPVRFDKAELPIDARAIETTDFDDWNGDPSSPPFPKLIRALQTMLGTPSGEPEARVPMAVGRAANRVSVCVLPFANMSTDREQDYFSDGVTEDIITALAGISALTVTSRNTAFSFKGKEVKLRPLARQLNVTHFLEGSVRKAGDRVRISAQLIDAAQDRPIWADRYDRDLRDIFALQTEISEAIVAALKIALLPEEKKAIGDRGTVAPDAYNLYLMARQFMVTGNLGSLRNTEAMARLCRKAVDIDPLFARAWAMLANSEARLRMDFSRSEDGGMAAARRALALDAGLAEAHAAMCRVLTQQKELDEARREVEAALRLDPDSYETNEAAGRLHYAARRTREAIPFFAKAAALAEGDYLSAGMLMVSYSAVGEPESARAAARRTLARTEKIVAIEPDNGSAMSYLVFSLILLGERGRAKDWMERALLLDPDNQNMRYNFGCDLVHVGDLEAAIDMLMPLSKIISREFLNWWNTDPDLDALRELPRFKAMLAETEARLAAATASA